MAQQQGPCAAPCGASQASNRHVQGTAPRLAASPSQARPGIHRPELGHGEAGIWQAHLAGCPARAKQEVAAVKGWALPICGEYIPAKERKVLHNSVRAEAENKCIRCGHPHDVSRSEE